MHIRTPRDASALGIETVHQDLALCDNLDIVQNMFLGRERSRHFILRENEMETAANETLSSLAVTTVRSVRQPVASLSGGQRQSVAIAKAVLWNSKLVIMDEPTAALGVAQTTMVLELVRRLADRGLAVLIVSHNMNDVFEVADRIAVLYLGRLAAVRPAAEMDRQIVVDLMTTGRSDRDKRRPAGEPDDDRPRRTGAGADRARRTAADDEPRAGERPRRTSPSRRPVLATSLGEYTKATIARVRGGEAGVLPVVGGLLIISILFQSLNSNFLTAGNLVNLLIQGAAYMLLALGETFALLLGEIDLSIGFVSGIGGVVTAELVKQSTGWPWWAAIIARAGRLRADRAAAGLDHHPARRAVVRRHAGRPARLAGRHAAGAGPGRHRAHQQQRHQRHRQRQPHARRRAGS